MSSDLREKIISILLASSSSQRFTEIYREVGEPSRSLFSKVLKQLQADRLVTREQVDYKNVEYSLDREAYARFLQKKAEEYQDKLSKVRENGGS